MTYNRLLDYALKVHVKVKVLGSLYCSSQNSIHVLISSRKATAPAHGRIQRGGGTGGPDPLKNHKKLGFFRTAGPGPLKNHKATKPAFNFVSLSSRQRNAIEIAFRLRADDDPLIVAFAWIVSPL